METDGLHEFTRGTQLILMINHIGSQYLIIIYGTPHLTINYIVKVRSEHQYANSATHDIQWNRSLIN